MRLDIWTRARGKFAAVQIIAFLEWSSFTSWILWVQLYYQSYKVRGRECVHFNPEINQVIQKNYTPLETTVRLLPMNITGFFLLTVVGIIAGRVRGIYLLCESVAECSNSPTHKATIKATGTIATGLGCLLFAIIQVDAPYWAFGFPSAILIVWGADFVFSAGMLFISRVAHEDEQSVAGGIFQTCIQVRAVPFDLYMRSHLHKLLARNLVRPRGYHHRLRWGHNWSKVSSSGTAAERIPNGSMDRVRTGHVRYVRPPEAGYKHSLIFLLYFS